MVHNKGSVFVCGCSKYPNVVVAKVDGEVNVLSLAGEEENPGIVSPFLAISAAFCVRYVWESLWFVTLLSSHCSVGQLLS